MRFASAAPRARALLACLVLLLTALPTASLAQEPVAPAPDASTAAGGPLFVEDVGQFGAPGSGRFQLLGADAALWLDRGELWVTLFEAQPGSAAAPLPDPALDSALDPARAPDGADDAPRRGVTLRLHFAGANPQPQAVPFGRRRTVINYFIGSDPAAWRSGVPVWSGVRYVGLYPGLDLVVEGAAQGRWQWRAECTAADCAAALAQVQLQVEGAESVALAEPVAAATALRVQTAVGDYAVPLPAVAETAAFAAPALSGGAVTSPFATAAAIAEAGDSPVAAAEGDGLLYSTFLGGGGGDQVQALVVDAAGAAYVAGATDSTDFPTTVGAFDRTYNGGLDAFVAKLTPGGDALLYSTFLGGGGYDRALALAVDAAGAAYIAGSTRSTDFPTTEGAFDRTYLGGGMWLDGFVAKLAPDGSALLYSTFLGGDGNDQVDALAVDSQGAAYVAGGTDSTDFPTTVGAFDRTYNGGYNDAYVAKLTLGGDALFYGSYLGGGGYDYAYALALDNQGAAYVAGFTESTDFPTTVGAFDRTHGGGDYDSFLAKFASNGDALLYSTYLGGGAWDYAYALALDNQGAAYVAGNTESTDFPTTEGAYDRSFNGGDAYVAKLASDGSALLFSTFLGGGGNESAMALAVDGAGAAYVAGYTYSTDFPVTEDAFDRTYSGGDYDSFLVSLPADGSALLYGTYLGGGAWDYAYALALDNQGAAYVAGLTDSTDFPTTEGAYDRTHNGGQDAFVAKLDLDALPPVSYSVSGRVTANGAGLAGVTVSAGYVSATTDANGDYTISGLAAGAYTITPAMTGYSFTPPSLSVTLASDLTDLNFTAQPVPSVTYAISGRIRLASNSGLAGVSVSAGDASATTDANGNYTISGLAPGAYTVTPAKTGYTFTPPSRTFTVIGNMTADFSAAPTPPGTYTLSGRVTANGVALAGVTVAAGGRSGTTNAAGNYTISGLAPGAYTVTPAKSGYTFTPPSRTFTLSGNMTADFSAEPTTSSLSGRVTVDGAGLSGVTVSAGGRSATTDAAGNYTISGLPAGAYTVTPAKAGYIFSPATRNATLPPASSGNNFSAAHPPVILIPGVMGTRLAARPSNTPTCRSRPNGTAWLDPLHIGNINALILADGGRLPANPCDTIEVDGLVDSSGPLAIFDYYRSFPSALPGWGVSTFTYDWRLDIDDPHSLSDTVEKLDAFITSRFGSMPVVLVGHSMGGLVARAYVADAARAARVNKVITVGTPYLGAPKLAYSLMTGKVDLLGSSHLWGAWTTDTMALVRNSPGILALLPSRAYADAYPYYVESGILLDGYEATRISYVTSGKNAALLAAAADFHARLDSFDANLPFAGDYWVLAARDADTISRVTQSRCWSSSGWCYGTQAYFKGDGTVPEQSSRLLPQGRALVGNAKVCTYRSNVNDHAALMADPSVGQDILRILLGNQPLNCTVDATAASAMSAALAEEPPTLREVVVRGAAQVRVEGASGAWYGVDASGFVTGTLTDVTIEFLPDTTIVTMPQGADYRVITQADAAAPAVATAAAQATTAAVEVAVSDFAASASEAPMLRQTQTLFGGLDLPAAGSLTLAASAPPAELRLQVDADGDGAPEAALPPDAVLTDPAQAQDTLAPVTTLTPAGPQDEQGRYTGPVTVTLAAADAGSGVLRSAYSLDGGATWLDYGAPVEVAEGGAATVQAYTVDRAGNQEWPPQVVVLVFVETQRIYLPTVQR